MLMAYGQRFVVIALGQCLCACNIIVRAASCKSLMAFFSMAILIMLVDPTVAVSLPFHFAVVHEGTVAKPAIVGVVSEDLYPLISSPPFVCVLRLEGLFAGDLFHVIYVLRLAEVVFKYGGCFVSSFRRLAFEQPHKSGCGGFQLVA